MALTDNLVAVYELNESSGNTADATGGGKTLTNNNSTPFVSGKLGNCIDVERDSGHYFSRTDSAFSFGGDFTVAAWINYETVGGDPGAGIACYLTSESEGDWSFGINSDVPVLFHRPTGGSWTAHQGNYNAPSAAISISTWTHLVGRRSGGTYTIWVNGGNKSFTSFGGMTGWGTQSFMVGQMYPGNGWIFDGLIDQVVIWNAAKSDADIATLYNSGSGLAYASWGAGGGLTKSVADALTVGELVPPTLVITPGAPTAFPAHYYRQLMAS